MVSFERTAVFSGALQRAQLVWRGHDGHVAPVLHRKGVDERVEQICSQGRENINVQQMISKREGRKGEKRRKARIQSNINTERKRGGSPARRKGPDVLSAFLDPNAYSKPAFYSGYIIHNMDVQCAFKFSSHKQIIIEEQRQP